MKKKIKFYKQQILYFWDFNLLPIPTLIVWLLKIWKKNKFYHNDFKFKQILIVFKLFLLNVWVFVVKMGSMVSDLEKQGLGFCIEIKKF